jgi:hypothetical protein
VAIRFEKVLLINAISLSIVVVISAGGPLNFVNAQHYIFAQAIILVLDLVRICTAGTSTRVSEEWW